MENYQNNERYEMAYKRVKKIKGFYIHLLVYILVNLFCLFGNYYGNDFDETPRNSNFFSWEYLAMPFFWGIGLFSHWLSVFGKNILFGNNWEERKINQFMEKEKNNQWQ
jgi:hypothetical protein